MQLERIGTKGAAASGVRVPFRAQTAALRVQSTGAIEGIFNTATDGSEDCQLNFKVYKGAGAGGTGFTIPAFMNTAAIQFATGVDVVQGLGGLATTATAGFLFVASCAGTPTGVPANTYTNCVPIVYDRTAHKIWAYDTAWKATAALS